MGHRDGIGKLGPTAGFGSAEPRPSTTPGGPAGAYQGARRAPGTQEGEITAAEKQLAGLDAEPAALDARTVCQVLEAAGRLVGLLAGTSPEPRRFVYAWADWR